MRAHGSTTIQIRAYGEVCIAAHVHSRIGPWMRGCVRLSVHKCRSVEAHGCIHFYGHTSMVSATETLTAGYCKHGVGNQ